MRIRLIVVLCAALLAGSSLSATAAAPVTNGQTSKEDQAGNQVIPLLLNNFFVLFPGEKAPFVKNSKLMVPLQTTATIMGWIVDERGAGSSRRYQVFPTADPFHSVANLKEGADSAIYEGDLGFGIVAAPEYRANELYVPLTPILDGMPSYSYELQTYGQNKVLAVKEFELHRLLAQVQESDVQHPTYPYILEKPAYPLIPTFLDQHEITVNGKSKYRLKMNMQQHDNWNGGTVESIELKVMAVNHNGEVTTRIKSLPYLGDVEREILFDVPTKVDYVLTQSRYIYKAEDQPVFEMGYPLQAAMASAMAKGWANVKIFDILGMEPVGFRIESTETVIVVRKSAGHQQEITEQEKEQLIQYIYELASRTFPLRIEVEH
ncbi:hypothetical protein DFQ01_10675 [Paenibacillus cellulosilyticus]|uniref:Copper amine oxidase-like protein n=1 Tax=Paenibacillus cellulosilyticus TaxID=375489 RepID=A0A2V2YYI4_9BACL|nr:hypothetical protein [Paenibacillus cellulosilyticus]PWW04792.1 hypothetical protein DFQ01_10675 [Paenibacillus cellulosilyticus]QKS45913.1 hypothetical protein HUB94_16775 [Paenibacillus cellulosilyticus]